VAKNSQNNSFTADDIGKIFAQEELRLELFDAGAKQSCPEGGGEVGENNV
jgi:hypothetical protein